MMEEPRENKFYFIIGRRRNGKSTYTSGELIPAYLLTDFDHIYVIQGKRNNTYRQYEEHEKVTVIVCTSIKEVAHILRDAYNCCFIFDDAQILFGKNPDPEIIALIINLGQTNNDAFAVFHSPKKATAALWDICDGIELFNFKGSARSRSEYLEDEEIKEIDAIKNALGPYQHQTYTF